MSMAPNAGVEETLRGRDVTEGQRFVRERELLAAIVEESPDGIVVTDYPEMRVTYANATFAQDLGWERSELVGRSILEVAAGALGATTIAGLVEVARLGRPWLGEAERRLADGTVGRVQIRVTPRLAADGTVESYLVVVRDVTELREAERAGRASEGRYQSIVDGAVEGIYRTSIAGKILAANPALATILGYESVDALVNEVVDVAQQVWAKADDRSRFLRLLDEQGTVRGYECQFVRKDGTLIWATQNVTVVRGRDGQARYYDGFVEDITERKTAEQALEASRALLGSIVDATPDAIFAKDLEGHYRLLNRGGQLLTGKSEADVLGRDDTSLFAPADAAVVMAADREAMRASALLSVEETVTDAAGTRRTMLSTKGPLRDANGTVVGLFGVAHDITERNREARERERLTAVIEQSADGVVITDLEWQIVYANAAFANGAGRSASELVGQQVTDVAAAILDVTTLADLVRTVRAGQRWSGEVDRHGPDGTPLRVEATITPTRDASGDISGWIGVLRDVSERQRAHAALEASEVHLRTALDTMLEGVTIQSAIRDEHGRIVDFRVDYANSAIGVIGGTAGSLQMGRTLLELFPAHRANGLFEAYVRVVETGVPFESGAFRYLDPDAAGGPLDQVLDHRAAKLGDGYVLSVRDVTARDRAEREMHRLATAIEQSSDAVVITDTSGAIEYVNPAFEHTTGYTREEVLGQNPRILKSGVQGPTFYAAMWATLTSGQSFVADITNRRKDGSLFQEESVVSPIVDDAGAITSYVAVKRDVTRDRASEAAQQRKARERALIAGTLADLQVLPTVAATAAAICHQVVSLAGLATANLNYFTLEGPVMPLAYVRADGGPTLLRRLPFQRSRVLRERAGEGPWVEAWVRRPWHPYERLFEQLGVQAVAHVPVRPGGRLIGLLSVSSADANAVALLTESLPALLEFAGFAGALIGPAIADLTEVDQVRRRIAEIIKTTAFRSVFQPIVDLEGGAHAGYEALTRFSSGTAPNLVFDDARAVGLEADLELATLDAALSSAVALPRGMWLSLNVSPGLVATNGRLAALLRRADRPIVLEVTEHVPVDDYVALRAAIGRLRPGVRVAVDDAGSGVANFGHIVELRPAFVKLDIGLVHGIDSDLTRQALVVGLLHFATESHSQTIAEGVETEEELATLQKLGVPFAQGYLLGRPSAVEVWSGKANRPT
jgi:PAS domain S-box-containing protein